MSIEKKRAAEKMRQKSFEDRFKRPLVFLNGFFIVFAVLSAITGFNAFFEVVRYSLPLWAAGIAALVFLTAVEFGESFTMDEFFENLFSRKSRSPTRQAFPNIPRLVSAFGIYGLSIVLSCFGIYYGSKNFSTIKGETVGFYAQKTDSISQVFDAQIAVLDSTKKEYFKQNIWHGVLKNNTATEQFNLYEAQIADLKKDKRNTLSSERKSEAKDLLSGEMKEEFNAVFLGSWVFILGFIKLLKHWFSNYYAYRLTIENGLSEYYEPETDDINVVEPVSEPLQITGFAFGQNTPPTTTTAKTTNDTAKRKPCGNCGSVKKMYKKRVDAKYCCITCKTAGNKKTNHNEAKRIK